MPAAGTVTLHLWLYPIGEGEDGADWHYIGLTDGTGNYRSLDHWRADTRAWERREYDLSAYRGQVVTLYIGTQNDGDDDTAALYVDDVGLTVCEDVHSQVRRCDALDKCVAPEGSGIELGIERGR